MSKSMLNGRIFDIKEFAVHDGPGIRLTVFLKGCPLSCMWCHNPEGQSPRPQVMRGAGGSRVVGQQISSGDLAQIINRQAQVLKANEGGVTFLGGEPLQQADFTAEVIDRLEGVHVLLDTCGYGTEQNFRKLLERVNLVYYDLKLMDRQMSLRYTGKDNRGILKNLEILSRSNVPYVIRVPLVPGVTDTVENLKAVAAAVEALPGLIRVDLLPYNRAAGAKYQALGRIFSPDYDEDGPVNADISIFERVGIEVRVA